MKLALASRSAFGNPKPRSITPLTTLNIVVTPQMPRARTTTASAQNARSFTSTRAPTRRSRRRVSATIWRLDDGGRDLFEVCGSGTAGHRAAGCAGIAEIGFGDPRAPGGDASGLLRGFTA